MTTQTEVLKLARSVISSINRGKQHALTHNEETVFWQREEWVQWALDEVLPLIEEALAQPEQPAQRTDEDAGLRTFRLPEEQEFIEAMRRRTLKSTVGMTPAEIAERNALADAVLDEIFSQPEQPAPVQQEPVAWKDLTNAEMMALCRDIESHKHSAYDILWEVSTRLKARNTTPPQRKPLTDECERDCCGNTFKKVSKVCSSICPNGIKPK